MTTSFRSKGKGKRRKVYPIISGKRAKVNRGMTTASVIPSRTQKQPETFKSEHYGGYAISFYRNNVGDIWGSYSAPGYGKQILGKGKTKEEAFQNSKKDIDAMNKQDVKKWSKHVSTYPINSSISTKELQKTKQNQHHILYDMQKAVNRGDMSDTAYETIRKDTFTKQAARQPDLSHLVYRKTIGHYGGYYMDVPSEHYQEFKSHFPKREWPKGANIQKKDIREDFNIYGETNYRKRFPKSNYLYQIYFANNTKADQRLDFFKIQVKSARD